jgi:hypothetical protein
LIVTIVAMHSLRSTLEILHRGPDNDLVDFHLGRLLDGVSGRRAKTRGYCGFTSMVVFLTVIQSSMTSSRVWTPGECWSEQTLL